MGQQQSVIDRFKAEVVLAVQENNARRLYHLFMLATRHQLGEIAVVPSSGSSSNAASSLIQTIRSSGPAVTLEQYLRDVMQQSQPVNTPTYLAFHDDKAQGRPPPTGQGGYTPSAPGTSTFPTAAPVITSPGAASSIGSAITSWFKASPGPVSPYATLPSAPQQPPPPSIAQSLIANQPPPSSSSRTGSAPSQGNDRRLGMYAPPTLPSDRKEQAAAVAEQVAAPMANLMATAPSPTSASALPAGQSPSHRGSAVNSAASSSAHSAQQQRRDSGAAAGSSAAAAEFSRSTLPVNINTLRVGSDTLLIYAAKQDQTSIIHLLYQAGADLEHADVNGWSALTHAAAAGSIRAVRALLDIGADAMAKTKMGLTPSQCTSSPEIRRELEVEEMERRQQIESQVQLVTATRSIPLLSSDGAPLPSALPSAFSSSTQSIAFHTALYEIIVPVELRAGSKFDIQYRCPPHHSEMDCLSVYYVDSDRRPWEMRPRMGCSFYLGALHVGGDKYRRMTAVADNRTLPPGLYRLVYYDSTTATFPAASNLFSVIAQPSSGASGTSSLAAWFDPNAWSNPSSPSSQVDLSSQSASSTPIIFHPDFQLLSNPSTRNIQSFLLPIPPYFLFSFQLNPVAVRLALELDPELAAVRDALVPGKMREKDFWQAYFYKMVALDWRRSEDGREDVETPPEVVQDGPIEQADTPRNGASGYRPPAMTAQHSSPPPQLP